MNTAKRMSEALKKQSVPFDSAIFVRAVKDSFAGGKMLLTDDEAQAVLTAMQKEMHEEQQAKMQQAAEGNRKKAKLFSPKTKAKTAWSRCPAACSIRL